MHVNPEALDRLDGLCADDAPLPGLQDIMNGRRVNRGKLMGSGHPLHRVSSFGSKVLRAACDLYETFPPVRCLSPLPLRRRLDFGRRVPKMQAARFAGAFASAAKIALRGRLIRSFGNSNDYPCVLAGTNT